MKTCPNCKNPLRSARRDLSGASFGYCSFCGWDEETNVVRTDEAAAVELLEAAESVLSRVHRSDEHFATDAMYRTRAEELRLEADRLEFRDSAIRRLQYAVQVVRGRANVALDVGADEPPARERTR